MFKRPAELCRRFLIKPAYRNGVGGYAVGGYADRVARQAQITIKVESFGHFITADVLCIHQKINEIIR